MRAMPFALLLLGVSAAYFIVRGTTSLGDVPPLPAAAAVVGLAGACILLGGMYALVDRRLNQPPKPPYFVINKTHGRCLELDADGSYESCQRLLAALATEFGAECSPHHEAGPRPRSYNDRGYWNVTMFGQEFFVMRNRGDGICIWGPKPPADLSGFLRLVAHFNAVEFTSWQQKLVRSLKLRSKDFTVTQAR